MHLDDDAASIGSHDLAANSPSLLPSGAKAQGREMPRRHEHAGTTRIPAQQEPPDHLPNELLRIHRSQATGEISSSDPARLSSRQLAAEAAIARDEDASRYFQRRFRRGPCLLVGEPCHRARVRALHGVPRCMRPAEKSCPARGIAPVDSLAPWSGPSTTDQSRGVERPGAFGMIAFATVPPPGGLLNSRSPPMALSRSAVEASPTWP